MPRFGRKRASPTFGITGAFNTGGFNGPPQPPPKAPNPPPLSKAQKEFAAYRQLREQGLLKPKFARGLRKR